MRTPDIQGQRQILGEIKHLFGKGVGRCDHSLPFWPVKVVIKVPTQDVCILGGFGMAFSSLLGVYISVGLANGSQPKDWEPVTRAGEPPGNAEVCDPGCS